MLYPELMYLQMKAEALWPDIVMGIRRRIMMQVQSQADLSGRFMLSNINNQHLVDKQDKHENLQKIKN